MDLLATPRNSRVGRVGCSLLEGGCPVPGTLTQTLKTTGGSILDHNWTESQVLEKLSK